MQKEPAAVDTGASSGDVWAVLQSLHDAVQPTAG